MAYSVPATHTLDKPIIQALGASSTTAAHDLGYTVKSTTGRVFKYCLTDASTLAATAGYPVYWMVGTTEGEVTSDYSDSADFGAGFAGVIACAISAADTAYVWVQTAGYVPDASVSTGCAVSDTLSAYVDYYFETINIESGNSHAVNAIAMEADTATLADIILVGVGG